MLSLFYHGIWSHHISSIIPFVSTAAGGGEDMPQILADVAKLSGPGWCPTMDDGSLKLRNGIRNAMEENRRWQQHVRERKKSFHNWGFCWVRWTYYCTIICTTIVGIPDGFLWVTCIGGCQVYVWQRKPWPMAPQISSSRRDQNQIYVDVPHEVWNKLS